MKIKVVEQRPYFVLDLQPEPLYPSGGPNVTASFKQFRV